MATTTRTDTSYSATLLRLHALEEYVQAEIAAIKEAIKDLEPGGGSGDQDRIYNLTVKGQTMPRQMKAVVHFKNKPGTFAGEINGVFGYYQRPKRYTKVEYDRIVGRARSQQGHISTGGVRGGSNHPWTKPGERLKLLLAFKDRTKGTPTLDYNGIMRSTASRRLSQAAFWTNYRAIAP